MYETFRRWLWAASACLLLSIGAGLAITGSASAQQAGQTDELAQNNPFLPEIERLRQQVGRRVSAPYCTAQDYAQLRLDLFRAQRITSFQTTAHWAIYEQAGDLAQRQLALRAQYASLQGHYGSIGLRFYCGPSAALERMRQAFADCDVDKANAEFKFLQDLHRINNQRANAARRLGDGSTIDPRWAALEADESEAALRLAVRDQERYRDSKADCQKQEQAQSEQPQQDQQQDETALGDAFLDGTEEMPDELRRLVDSETARNICYDRFEELEQACVTWEPLLGRWINPEYGGVIEFVLAGENLVMARVVSASERMEEQGYAAGTPILRNWQFGGVDAGTWSFFANNGEAFSAVLPGREPGEVLGDPRWIEGGVIFIEKERPGILNLPADLEGRISNYEEWVRSGSVI